MTMALHELGSASEIGLGADIRGWWAMGDDGRRLGTVDALLVDSDQQLVTYIVVELSVGKRISWPAARLGFDHDARTVRLKGLTADAVDALDAYAGAEALDAGPIRLTLAEERLSVGKRRVHKGDVVVSKEVLYDEAAADVTLHEDGVEVTRVRVDRLAEPDEGVRVEGNVTRVPVIVERLFVEKRAYVVEEIHITKTSTAHTETVREVLRREEAVIENHPDDGDASR
jgi:uncharacterized protein (TIGR02271 family)